MTKKRSKESANPYFGRKSFGGKGLSESPKQSGTVSQREKTAKLRKKLADRNKVVAIILGAVNAPLVRERAAKVKVKIAIGKSGWLVTEADIALSSKGGYQITGKISALNLDNQEKASTEFNGRMRTFTAIARGHIARQVSVLKQSKIADAQSVADRLAAKAHINKLISKANAFIEKSDVGLDKIPEFTGNATARPQYEGASMKRNKPKAKPISPWSDSSDLAKEVAELTDREQETAGLVNPLLSLVPEKISPNTPPLSPSSRKPMIAAFVGPAKGAKTRVWISIDERVCLPRLRGNKE